MHNASTLHTTPKPPNRWFFGDHIIIINNAYTYTHKHDACDGSMRERTQMQQVMRIGNEFVPADDNLKDIGCTSTEITDVARKYKTDVLAIIGKGDDHNIVAQYHEQETLLEQDLIKAIALVETIADTYKVNATQVAKAITYVVEKESEDA